MPKRTAYPANLSVAYPDPWEARAACLDLFDLFHAPDTGHPIPPARHQERETRALAVCATCPVRPECLDAYLTEEEGIFGGTTPEQRAQLRRRHAEAVA